MLKEYTVSLCPEYVRCKQQTEAIAEKNGAINWIVEPVVARRDVIFGDTWAYRGKIIMDNRKQLAKLICEATQKTNSSCSDDLKAKCAYEGCCAYCLTIAEHLLENSVVVINE